MPVNNQRQQLKSPAFKGELNIVRGADHLGREAVARLAAQYKEIGPKTTRFDFELYDYGKLYRHLYNDCEFKGYFNLGMKLTVTDKAGQITEYHQHHVEDDFGVRAKAFENLIGNLGKVLKAVSSRATKS